jgi:glycosyltransferase involved in cell wall biosynthesis
MGSALAARPPSRVPSFDFVEKAKLLFNLSAPGRDSRSSLAHTTYSVFPVRKPRQRSEPFFAVAAKAPFRRRILLLSYHFPPGTGAGALRWQKISRQAAEHGWGFDVVTLDAKQLPSADVSRLEELGPGTRVFGAPHPRDAIQATEQRVWSIFRALFPRRAPGSTQADGAPGVILDTAVVESSLASEQIRWDWRSTRGARRAFAAWLKYREEQAWANEAARVASALVDHGSYDLLITSGPPHLVHEAGRRVAGRARIPLVMDLRDPWSLRRRLPANHASPLWFSLADRLERRAVARATLIITNTQAVKKAMIRKYPGRRDRILTIMNGYDDEEIPTVADSTRFVIAYAGAIYLDRDPRVFLRAASMVVKELSLTPAEFGIQLIGHVERYGSLAVSALAEAEGLNGFVEIVPPVSRQELMQRLAGASMLISLPQDSQYAIPSKIFEYMQFPAWVLALSPHGTPVEVLLKDTEADVADPRDATVIAGILRKRVLEHRSGVRPAPLASDGRFSRRRQTELLMEALERTLEPSSTASVPRRSETNGEHGRRPESAAR